MSVEDHQVDGGLGSAIAEVLSRNLPTPQEYIGLQNTFGESGKIDELLTKYKMDKDSIKEAVRKAMSRKSCAFEGLVSCFNFFLRKYPMLFNFF